MKCKIRTIKLSYMFGDSRRTAFLLHVEILVGTLKIQRPNMAVSRGFGPYLLSVSGVYTAYTSSCFFMTVVTNLRARGFITQVPVVGCVAKGTTRTNQVMLKK